MASNGAEPSAKLPPEWADLELSVRRLLDQHDALRARAERAEARCAELEASLQDFATGAVDPADVQKRAARLERENADLRDRLEQARERVGRVMERIRFAEESR